MTTLKVYHLESSEMAQRIKERATSPNDLNVTPKTHMVERENKLPQVVL